MKFFALLVMFSSLLFSKVYYAKVEPFELRNISSNVSGLVTFTADSKVGQKLSSRPYIKIDSKLNKVELDKVEQKIKYLKNTLQSTQKILENLKLSLEKKRENYKTIESLSVKSRLEKDKEFYDLMGSENSYLSTQKEINSLKIQLADLALRDSQLKRSLQDKSLRAKGLILYSILVKAGQVVNITTPLAQVADTSHGRLIIYLDYEDIKNIEKKVVYIDGKKTSYKVSRILHIADSTNISRYRAEVIIDAPKIFSKLVKVELKDE